MHETPPPKIKPPFSSLSFSSMASPSQEDPKTPKESPLKPTPIVTRQFNYPSFSALLEGVVMAANSAASSSLHPPNPLLQNVTFKGQFGMSHQEALASVTAKAAQVQHPAEFANSALVASPYNKPMFSAPVLPEKKDDKEEGEKRNSSNKINKPVNDIAKTPNSDGYSWRKYGQKQVKSSESFRSYYRCTHAGCQAKKKVQHADKLRCIVGVDYKGQHSHDPSTKVKEKSLKTCTADAMPIFKIDTDTLSANKKLADLNLSASGVNEQIMSVDDRSEPQKSSNCHGTTDMDVEEHDKKTNLVQCAIVQQPMPLSDEPSRSIDTNEHTMTDVMKGIIAPCGQKRRMKDRARAHSLHLQKTPKETKVVVHAAGDVGISADGYRWRKYGQKMVKGNTNPRSYYRCTCAGCPARKHVEMATDNSTATIVTYEGKHDHDKPVPKKHYSSTSSTPQCSSVNATPSEKTADAAKGSDKMIESARTLLSIGIELKSC